MATGYRTSPTTPPHLSNSYRPNAVTWDDGGDESEEAEDVQSTSTTSNYSLIRMLFLAAAPYTVDSRILALPKDTTDREVGLCCFRPRWLKSVANFANANVEAEFSVFKSHGPILAELVFLVMMAAGAGAIFAAPLPPGRTSVMYYFLGGLLGVFVIYTGVLIAHNWRRNALLTRLAAFGDNDRIRNALVSLADTRGKASLAWPFMTLCLGMLVAIGASYCPKPPAPDATPVAEACRNSCPVSIALAVSMTVYFASRPLVAVLSLSFIIFAMCVVQAAVVTDYDPSEIMGRTGLLFSLAIALSVVSLGREAMLRDHFSSLVANQRIQASIVKQIAVLGQVVEQVLPRRVAKRVASLQLDPDADAPMLWDTKDAACVAVIEAVDFGLFGRRLLDVDVTAMLHRLYTLFDSATALFGIDKAAVFGDAYAVTAGLLTRRTKPVDVVHFAWWAKNLDDGAQLPLRAAVCVGTVEGGVSSSSAAPRYIIGGTALQLAQDTVRTIASSDVVVCAVTAAQLISSGEFLLEWLSGKFQRFARIRALRTESGRIFGGEHENEEVELGEDVLVLPDATPSSLMLSPSAIGNVVLPPSVHTVPHAVSAINMEQSAIVGASSGSGTGSGSGAVAIENLARVALRSRWTRDGFKDSRPNPLRSKSPASSAHNGSSMDRTSEVGLGDDDGFWRIEYGTFTVPEAETLYREMVRTGAQATQWRPLLAVLLVTIVYAIFAFVISPPTTMSLLNVITYGGAGLIVITHVPVIILNFKRPEKPPFYVTAILFAMVLAITVAYIWVAPSSTMRNDPLFTVIPTVALLKHFVLAPLPAWVTVVILNVFYVIPLAALYEFTPPGIVLIILLPLLSFAYIFDVARHLRESFAVAEQVKDSLHAAEDAAERLRVLVANIVPPHVVERGLDWMKETGRANNNMLPSPGIGSHGGRLHAAIEHRLQSMMAVVRGRHNVVVTDVFASFVLLRVRIVPRASSALSMSVAQVTSLIEFAASEAASSVFRHSSVIPIRTLASLGYVYDFGGPFPNAAEPYVPKWVVEQTREEAPAAPGSPRTVDIDDAVGSFTSATGFNARVSADAPTEFSPVVSRQPRPPLRERSRMVVMPSDDDVRGAAVGSLALVRLISLALVPLGFDIYAAVAEEEASAALLGEGTLRYGVSGAVSRRIQGLSAILDMIQSAPRARRLAQPCFVASTHFVNVIRDALDKAERRDNGIVFPVDIPHLTPLSRYPVRIPDLSSEAPIMIQWSDQDIM